MKVISKKSLPSFLPHVFNALALAVILYYGFWFISDGRYPQFHHLENYYVNFAEALKKGQVALLDQPDARLAYLQNPHLAPDSGIPFLWDVSYFHGKYYIYWGPTPVIDYLVYSIITGQPGPAQLGVLSAYTALACLLLALLYLLRRHFFPRAPVFSIGIFLLAACLNPPYAFLISRPLTYETAILTGQLCLLLGITFWVLYLIYKKGWLLAPAGAAWGLAVLARYDTVISVFVYTAVALFYLWKARPAHGASGREHAARNAVLLILPLAVCALTLEVYNTVRFGSPFETGLRYQLTTPVETYYSAHFLASNLYVYLFYPNPVTNRFPFISVEMFNPALLPGWAGAAPAKQFDYGFYGLFSSTPIFWLEPLAFAALGMLLTLRRRAPRPRPAAVEPLDPNHALRNLVPVTGFAILQEQATTAILQTMLILAGLLQLFFLLFYYYSAVRFLSDFWLPLVLAGFLVFWELDGYLIHRRWLRVNFWTILAWAGLQTALAGFLTGFTLFPFYFAHHNVGTFRAIMDDLNQHNRFVSILLKPTNLISLPRLPGLIGKILPHIGGNP